MANTLTLTDQFSPCQYRSKQKARKGSASNHATSSLSNSLAHCDQLSSSAVIDILILILVLGACGVLITPYFKFLAAEAAQVVPAALILVGEVVIQAPMAYAGATLFMFGAMLVGYEILQYKARRCENPHCRGLSKAMELDIQLETEECVKSSPWGTAKGTHWSKGAGGLGQDQRELEAELRRMAPPNGRAVLIFRAPCGCPAARFEASGSKKALRRTKK